MYVHAGPEVCVVSTKCFTDTTVAFALLALHLGRIRDLSVRDGKRIIEGLRRAARRRSTEILEQEDEIRSWPQRTPRPARCSSSAASGATRWPARPP